MGAVEGVGGAVVEVVGGGGGGKSTASEATAVVIRSFDLGSEACGAITETVNNTPRVRAASRVRVLGIWCSPVLGARTPTQETYSNATLVKAIAPTSGTEARDYSRGS